MRQDDILLSYRAAGSGSGAWHQTYITAHDKCVTEMATSLPTSGQFLFRRFIFHYADSLNDQQTETLKFVLKDYIGGIHYQKPQAYRIFAALEIDGKISSQKLDLLKPSFSNIGRSFEDFKRDLSIAMTSPSGTIPKGAVLSEKPKNKEFNREFHSCLSHLGDELLKGDSDVVNQLLYLCPEIPLSNLDKFHNGMAFFEELKKRRLISCWDLSYLHSRLEAIRHENLCQFIEKQTQEVQLKAIKASSEETAKRRASFASVRSHSWPERQSSCEENHVSKAKQKLEQKSSTSDKFTIFSHLTYKILYYFSSKPVVVFLYGFLGILGVLMVVKGLLEYKTCGHSTAILNFISRGLTHVVLPFSILLYSKEIFDSSKLTKLDLVNRTYKEEALTVFKSLVKALSSGNEWASLELKCKQQGAIAMINQLLRHKLAIIAITSSLTSASYFVGVLYLQSSNFSTFLNLDENLALIFKIIMTTAAFIIHMIFGIAGTLYLYEMRIKEYLMLLVKLAKKKRINQLVKDAANARSVLSDRWYWFERCIFIISLIFLFILIISIFTKTPFRCCGERMKINDGDVNKIKLSWFLWILVGFVCHLCAYSYRLFFYARCTALSLQVLFLLITCFDLLGHKWGTLIQITNAIYPTTFTIWVLFMPFCHKLSKETWSRRPSKPAVLTFSAIFTVLNDSTVLCKACFAVVLLIASAWTLICEYSLLTEKLNSLQ